MWKGDGGGRDCIRHLSQRPHTHSALHRSKILRFVWSSMDYCLLSWHLACQVGKTFQAVFKHNSCFSASPTVSSTLSLSLLSIGSSAHFPFICFLLVLCLSFGKVDATSRTTQGHFKTEATDDRAEFDRQTEKERKKERGRVRQMESGG